MADHVIANCARQIQGGSEKQRQRNVYRQIHIRRRRRRLLEVAYTFTALAFTIPARATESTFNARKESFPAPPSLTATKTQKTSILQWHKKYQISNGDDRWRERGRSYLVFRALLHPEWCCHTGDKIFLRFGANELGNWAENVLHLNVEGQFPSSEGDMLLLRGHHAFPADLIQGPLAYKYVVLRTRMNHYEYEFVCGDFESSADRVLRVPEEILQKNDEYVKYDHVVRNVDGVLHRSGRSVQYCRKLSLRAMFPRWSGFLCENETGVACLKAERVLHQLRNLIRQVEYTEVMEVPCGRIRPWTVPQLDIRETICRLIRAKVAELGQLSRHGRFDRVVSAVAIASTASFLKIPFPHLDFKSLAVALLPDLEKKSFQSFEAIKAHFDSLKLVFQALTYVFSELSKNRLAEGVLLIPLFHFLTDALIDAEFNWKTEEWWSIPQCITREIHWLKNIRRSKFEPIIGTLEPLLALDTLSVRVVLFCTKFDDLYSWIGFACPGEIVVAFVKKLLRRNASKIEDDRLCEFLRQLTICLASTNTSDNKLSYLVHGTDSLIDAMCYLFRRREFNRLITTSTLWRFADLLLTHLQLWHRKILAWEHNQDCLKLEHYAEKASKTLSDWMLLLSHRNDPLSSCSVISIIKLWSDLVIRGSSLHEPLAQNWVTWQVEPFKIKLKNWGMTAMRSYRDIFSDIKCLQAEIGNAFLDFAEETFTELFQDLCENDRSPLVSDYSVDHSTDFLVQTLRENTPDLSDSSDIWLENLLSWPLWHHFLNAHSCKTHAVSNNEELQQIIEKAKNAFHIFAERLNAADVSSNQVKSLLNNRHLPRIIALLDNGARSLRVEEALRQLQKQVIVLEDEIEAVKAVLGKFLKLDDHCFENSAVKDLPLNRIVFRNLDGSFRVVSQYDIPENLQEKFHSSSFFRSFCAPKHLSEQRDEWIEATQQLSKNLKSAYDQLSNRDVEVAKLKAQLERLGEENRKITASRSAEATATEERVQKLQRDYENARLLCQEKEHQMAMFRQRDELLNIPTTDVKMTEICSGEGSYAREMLGYWRGSRAAVKTFHSCLKSNHSIALFRQEIDISSHIRHPKIATLFGVTESLEGPVSLVTRLLEGSLSDVIYCGVQQLTLREQTDLAVGFTAGLSYLHQLPTAVLHGDIRSTSILVNAMLKAQIADFGTAARFVGASLSAGRASREYVAPERMDGNASNTMSADVYSLGVTYIELMISESPVVKSRRSQADKVLHPHFQDLCLQAISHLPSDRPSAARCLRILEKICETELYNSCPPKRLVRRQHATGGGTRISLV